MHFQIVVINIWGLAWSCGLEIKRLYLNLRSCFLMVFCFHEDVKAIGWWNLWIRFREARRHERGIVGKVRLALFRWWLWRLSLAKLVQSLCLSLRILIFEHLRNSKFSLCFSRYILLLQLMLTWSFFGISGSLPWEILAWALCLSLSNLDLWIDLHARLFLLLGFCDSKVLRWSLSR